MNCDYCGHVPKLGVEHPLKYHGPAGRKNSWHCDDKQECILQCRECQDLVKAVSVVGGVDEKAPIEKVPGSRNVDTSEDVPTERAELKSAVGYAELMAKLKGGAGHGKEG